MSATYFEIFRVLEESHVDVGLSENSVPQLMIIIPTKWL